MKKALVALAILLGITGTATSQIIGNGGIQPQTINYSNQVGVGNWLTVQAALTDQCSKNGGFGQVFIQQGAVPADGPTIGGMSSYTINGCTNVTILDQRGLVGASCYSFSNSTTYVRQICAAGGSSAPCPTCVVTNPSGTQTVTQPVNTNISLTTSGTGTALVNSLNTVINVTGTLNAAITTCGSNPTTLQITTGVTLSTSVTVPKNCTLLFQSGGELLPTTGQVVTFAAGAQVQASKAQQIFGGLGTEVGLSVSYPEWFGAVVYGGGTDDSSFINAAITATSGGVVQLQPQIYGISSPLSITTAHTTLNGTDPGGTIIQNNSATADSIDVVGGTPSAPGCTSVIFQNSLTNFTVTRNVAASGSSKGISLVCVQIPLVSNVFILDNIHNLYLNGAVDGFYLNVYTVWVKTYTTTTMYGIDIDSENGTASNGGYFDNAIGDCSGAGAVFPNVCYGLYLHGKIPGDNWFRGYQSAGGAYGAYLLYDGTSVSPQDGVDIQFDNPIVTETGIPGGTGAAIYATGFTYNTTYGPAITINGGTAVAFNGPAIDIESSASVQVGGGIRLQAQQNATHAFIANNSSYVSLSNAQVQSEAAFDTVDFSTCAKCSMQNVSLQGVTGIGGTPPGLLHVTNSTGGLYSADVFSGAVGTAAVILDSTSGGTANNFGPFQNNTGSALYSGTAGITSLQQMNATNIIDSALTNGTGSICPNGTGGLFVNTGCLSGGVANALTGAASGGAAAGSTYNGTSAVTFDFHTLGAAAANLGMTTLGDSICGGASGAATRLAGPTTTGHVFAFSNTPVSSLAVACAWYDMTLNMAFLANSNTFTQPQTINSGGTNVSFTLTSSSNFGSEIDITGTGTGVHHWAINSGGSGDKAGALLFPDLTVGIYGWGMNVTNNTGLGFQEVPSLMVFSWSSTSDIKTTPPDTGISRGAPDTLDCGNGTQGDSSCTFNASHLVAGTDIKLASNTTWTAVTGTGGTVVMSVSPALTGTPTTPTASPGTGGTQVSSQGYADASSAAAVRASESSWPLSIVASLGSANTQVAYIPNAATVTRITVQASFSACVTPPTIAVLDCGTSLSTNNCTSPSTISSFTLPSAAGTSLYDSGTISGSITAGHFIEVQASSASCAGFISGSAMTTITQ